MRGEDDPAPERWQRGALGRGGGEGTRSAVPRKAPATAHREAQRAGTGVQKSDPPRGGGSAQGTRVGGKGGSEVRARRGAPEPDARCRAGRRGDFAGLETGGRLSLPRPPRAPDSRLANSLRSHFHRFSLTNKHNARSGNTSPRCGWSARSSDGRVAPEVSISK